MAQELQGSGNDDETKTSKEQVNEDLEGMAIPVVEFSREGFRFQAKNQMKSNKIIEFCKLA